MTRSNYFFAGSDAWSRKTMAGTGRGPASGDNVRQYGLEPNPA